MSYYPSNCTDLPQHDCNPCEGREYGRIRSAGFISKDYYTTLMASPADPSVWATGQESNLVVVIPETNGSMSAGAAKMGPGYGETVETLLGYEFTAKFNDPNFVSNASFYNALIGQRNYYFFYRTSTQTFITNVTVTIVPNREIKDDLNSEIVWENTVKWIDVQFDTQIDTPDGVFDECFTGA
jgi:hypothetical protein